VTLTILGIAATILSGGLLLLRWWLSRRADPKVQAQKREDENAKAIAKGAAGIDDINRLVESKLRALPTKSGGDPGGS
jgi:hypothetical protein